MFHRHKWKVVSKEEQPSMLDRLLAANATRIKTGYGTDAERRYVIVHYRCEECDSEKVVRV